MVTRPLRAAEVAKLFGISRDTLRHYERRGLIRAPERSAGGYRLYSAAAVERVRLIRGALAIGFTVEELAAILRQRDRGEAPCGQVVELAQQKLEQLDERIAELCRLREALARTLREWKGCIRRTDSGPARLLETFVAAHPEAAELLSPQVSPGLARRFQKRKRKP